MRLLLLCLCALLGQAFGAFVAPAEGPVPFRRDKLPVDVDTMTKLSAQLVTMVGSVEGDGPEESRTKAQMLALSVALDPSNNQARDLAKKLSEGGTVSSSEDDKVGVARTRAWNLLGWLEQPEAGEDGLALGACLGDVLCRADREHPASKKRLKNGERGQWNEWVAEPGAFRDREEPMVDQGDSGDNEDEPVGEDAAKIVLNEVKGWMPIKYRNNELKKTFLRPVEFGLKAWTSDEAKHFAVRLPHEDWGKAMKRSSADLQGFLESRHGPMPKGLLMSLELPEGIMFNYERDGSGLSSLVAVMADAVFSGVAPDAMILAAVDDEGILKASNSFWPTLRTLAANDENGRRMVIAADARGFLPPLLTLDQAQFFMNHEVLLAKDLDELIALSSSQPAEEVKKAHEAFETIQAALGTRSLGSFVSHSSTKQRLDGIYADLPAHASARMLALRGTSSWPKRLEREIYAREIRSAIEPMGRALEGRWESLNTSSLNKTQTQCRERLGEIEKLFESVGDRTELYDPAVSTIKTLGNLSVDLKRMDETDKYKIPIRVKSTYRGYVATLTMLTVAIGDQGEYKLPTTERTR